MNDFALRGSENCSGNSPSFALRGSQAPTPASARCPSCGGSSRLTAKGNIQKNTRLRQRRPGEGAACRYPRLWATPSAASVTCNCASRSLSARDGGAFPATHLGTPHLHFTHQRIVRAEKMLRKLDRIVMTPAAPLLQYLPSRRFGEGRYRGHANATSTLQEQRSVLRPKSGRGVQGRGAASDLPRRRWSPRSLRTSEQTW